VQKAQGQETAIAGGASDASLNDLGLALTDYLLGRLELSKNEALYESTRVSLRRQADDRPVDNLRALLGRSLAPRRGRRARPDRAVPALLPDFSGPRPPERAGIAAAPGRGSCPWSVRPRATSAIDPRTRSSTAPSSAISRPCWPGLPTKAAATGSRLKAHASTARVRASGSNTTRPATQVAATDSRPRLIIGVACPPRFRLAGNRAQRAAGAPRRGVGEPQPIPDSRQSTRACSSRMRRTSSRSRGAPVRSGRRTG
jgi:hypothetical protein